MHKYISTNPEIMSGSPVIAGTRVLVERILVLVRQGHTLPDIQKMYPHVTLRQLQGAIDEVSAMIEHNATQIPQI